MQTVRGHPNVWSRLTWKYMYRYMYLSNSYASSEHMTEQAAAHKMTLVFV